jgi:hypothetical protein
VVTVLSRFAVVGVLCTLSIPALGQSTPPVAVGQRIRVWTDSAEAITGDVGALDSSALRIDHAGRDSVTVPMSVLRRVEVSRAIGSKSAGGKKGALRGAIIGAVIGAIALGLQHDEVGDEGSSAAQAAALGAWSGGLFGGLIGAGVGAARAAEKWETVWP